MKKVAISIIIAMALSINTFANTGNKNEISKEKLMYFKSINPSITNLEVNSMIEHREHLDELYKQIDKLEKDYGTLVDYEKEQNKEPKRLADLPEKQLENYFNLSEKIYKKELEFLDAQYKFGLIKKDIYIVDKELIEDLRDKELIKKVALTYR
ncbi:hypothetical protein [Bacillus toyonensis]|uniref:hypothetical protein n=1 Tax=Bacillus toyonensis TaxID=155322 RepID=UPI000BF11936|nr:hypothetical protein [Bacillus toyonensis]PEK10679.1 hypothetical protein CN681_10865 [Bacillus toyonensis]PGA50122.1 hypothetical protein COL86_30365 [Bacillus toyonensis]PGB91171.1 hypothetical protein COM19_30475 [Bacillus toyonensis]